MLISQRGSFSHLVDSKTGKNYIVPQCSGTCNSGRASTCWFICDCRAMFQKSLEPGFVSLGWPYCGQGLARQGTCLHDLRHTHASFGVNAGMGLPIIGKLLGHTQVATTQRYAHLADYPVRQSVGENRRRACRCSWRSSGNDSWIGDTCFSKIGSSSQGEIPGK